MDIDNSEDIKNIEETYNGWIFSAHFNDYPEFYLGEGVCLILNPKSDLIALSQICNHLSVIDETTKSWSYLK